MAGHYIPERNQSYLQMYSWEEIDLPFWRQWFSVNWPYSLGLAGVYYSFIYFGQKLMEKRKAYDLKNSLAFWNFSMAVFSGFAFVRVFPELLFLLSKPNGLYLAACELNHHGMSMAFWALTYTLSKALQLGDTVFIVLRKKKLILLHWYHHASVMIIAWYAYQPYIPLLRFVGNMNYFVHFWMYSYYGFRALEINVPKKMALVVTVLELIQMVLGLYLTAYVIYQHYFGRGCLFSPRAVTVSCTIYSTLFILFARHFRATAFKKRVSNQKAKSS